MFAINQLLKADPLDIQILFCVNNAKEPISCSDIYAQLKNAPDTKTVSVEVNQLKLKGFIQIAYMAKDDSRNIPREVAFYQITTKGETHLNNAIAQAVETTSETNPAFLHQVIDAVSNEAKSSETKERTNAYRVLEFIEKNPSCTAKQIESAVGLSAKNVGNCIYAYISDGAVIVDKTGREYKFTLTKPLAEAYQGKGHKHKKSAISGEQQHEIISTQTEQASALDQPANALLEWDTSGDQNQVVSSAQNDTQETVNGDDRKVATTRHTPEDFFKAVAAVKKVNAGFDRALNIEAAKPAFRCAYTSDKCLMLFGLNDYGLPVELDAEQTFILMKFIGDQALSENVSAVLEDRMSEILRK